MLYRLTLHTVTLAADDTDYQLEIPSGAKSARLGLSSTSKAWRFGLASVADPASANMPVAAGQTPVLFEDAAVVKTTLHFAITGGTGAEKVTLYCVTPITR